MSRYHTHRLAVMIITAGIAAGLITGCAPQPYPATATPTPHFQPVAASTEDTGPAPDTQFSETPAPTRTEADPVIGSPQESLSTEPTATPVSAAAAHPWQELPVIPTLSDKAITIYQRGLVRGTDPHAFSVIGDCQSATLYFLTPFATPESYSLGEYDYLQATIDHFYGSFARERLAARDGFNGASVLSTMWADPEQCEPGETPLDCELRVNNPSIIIISMGTNWSDLPAEEHERYMRAIIEQAMLAGVLPILSTKADNLEGDHSINASIARLAEEYDLPLWNFWRTVQDLPDHGLEDEYHLTYSQPFFDNEERMQNGWPVRNLSALQLLDAVWHAVSEDGDS